MLQCPAMDQPEDDFPSPYTFCNCGKKGCPTASDTPDGVLLEAPSAELVATDGGVGVPFTHEQARDLLKYLKKRYETP